MPDADEAAVVRLIFGTYTRDRLGARAIATLLNDRGHRTTTGGHGPPTRYCACCPTASTWAS